MRDFIEDRWKELERYDAFAKRFRPPQLAAGECRSLDELNLLARDLQGRLAPPTEDAEAWGETEMVRLRHKWAIEVDALRDAEGKLTNSLAEQSQKLHRLILSSTFNGNWWNESQIAVIDEPFAIRPDEPLPGSFEIPVLGGEKLTYGTAFEFDRVDAARREWESSRERMTRLRELVMLLGLAGPSDDAWLDQTSPAIERMTALRTKHPALLESPLAYAVPNWGDPNRELIRGRLERSLDRFVVSIQDRIKTEILAIGMGQESLAAWQLWSTTASVKYQSDGELLMLLDTLRSGQRPTISPMEAIIETMTKEKLIPINAMNLMTSDRPASMTWTIGDQAIDWKIIGEPTMQRGQWTTRFEPNVKSIRIDPGLSFQAQLTTSREGQLTVLTWDRSRSTVVPYDRFSMQPMILVAGQKPIRATGVIVKFEPETAWPMLPTLLPDFGKP